MKRAIYDLLYRIGAPWDGPPRPELVTLVESGVLTPARLAPGRAIDLGCGTGANVRYLTRHGFDATGVDFSPVALRVARKRANAEGADGSIRFLEGDLTAGEIPGVEGPFDLLVDYGTLDDLDPAGRRAMAAAHGSDTASSCPARRTRSVCGNTCALLVGSSPRSTARTTGSIAPLRIIRSSRFSRPAHLSSRVQRASASRGSGASPVARPTSDAISSARCPSIGIRSDSFGRSK